MLLDMSGANWAEAMAALLVPVIYAALVGAFGALARGSPRPRGAMDVRGRRRAPHADAGDRGPIPHRSETKRYQRRDAAAGRAG
jgi:hypothetical protein